MTDAMPGPGYVLLKHHCPIILGASNIQGIETYKCTVYRRQLSSLCTYYSLTSVRPTSMAKCLVLFGICYETLMAMKLAHFIVKVSNGAKIRNRYNQVPHLTQDTNGKVTNSQKTPQTRAKRSALSQQVTTKHI